MPSWEEKKTDETCQVEALLRRTFPNTEAYRFNSASIRVMVIDPRFEGMSIEEREALVWPLLEQLPEATRSDILLLLTLAPSEVGPPNQHSLINLEFEQPSLSRL